MTRKEYNVIGLPEATLTFQRDDDAGDTYVFVRIESPLPMQSVGFKFIVSNAIMDGIWGRGRS